MIPEPLAKLDCNPERVLALTKLVNGTIEGGLSGALFTCVSRSVSDGDLFMVRVSFGLGTPLVY